MSLTPEERNKGYYSFMNEAVDPTANSGAGAVVRRYTSPAIPTATPVAPPAPTPTPATFGGNPLLSKPTLGTFDENAIREETRKRMQSSIDAIEANYANLISQERVIGVDRAGQTRATNARSGLMGSDFGAANQEKTTQFNQQQVKALEDEKMAKVNAVLLNIEDRASAEIQGKKGEALDKYKLDMGEFEKAQEAARGDFAALAKAGVDLNKLNPAQKAALLQQTGYDEGMGELIYNAMKPQAQKIDYKFEKLADGRGLFYGVDPTTGQLVTKEVSMDIPDDMSLTIAPDGTPILFNKTTGEARVADGFGQGQFAKPEEAEQLYGGLTKDQRSELQRVQSNVRQDPDVKDFITIRDGYERVQTGANRDDSQGDLALLFGFMKMLDPNSVVRETEFANAEQAQGTLQRFFNIPDKFIRGTRLTTEGRKHFADAARELYERKEQSYQKAVDFYGNQLDAYEIPREMGLRDFGTTFEDTSTPSQLTPLNGNDPRRFTNKLIGKYPYLEVAQFIGKYPDATEAEIMELVGGSEGTNPKAKTSYLDAIGTKQLFYGSPKWKAGLDAAGTPNTPIPVPKSGEVIAAGKEGGFGNRVKVKLQDGYTFAVGHLNKIADITNGMKLAAGKVIGLMGNTGTVLTSDGRKPTAKELAAGRGTHADITMWKPNGQLMTAKEVKAYLDKIKV